MKNLCIQTQMLLLLELLLVLLLLLLLLREQNILYSSTGQRLNGSHGKQEDHQTTRTDRTDRQ